MEIKNFSGRQEEYAEWDRHCFNCAEGASPHCFQMMGLLGWFLTAINFLIPVRAVGVAGVFVERPAPGARPILPNAPIAAEIGHFNYLLAIWNEIRLAHEGERSCLAKWTQKYINAIPEHCLAAIKDDVHHFRNLTLLQIHQHMDNQFLVMSPADLAANLSLLDIPFSFSNTVAEFIAMQRKIAGTQAANGQPISESRRTFLPKQAFLHPGVYNDRIFHWEIEADTVILQTFDGLATAILEFERNRVTSTVSAAAHYASSTIPSHATSQPSTALVQIQAQMATMAATMAAMQSHQQQQFFQQKIPYVGAVTAQTGGGAGGHKRLKAAGGGGFVPRPAGGGVAKGTFKYCWSHGACKHPSPACMTKSAGHQDAATFANQLDGTPA